MDFTSLQLLLTRFATLGSLRSPIEGDLVQVYSVDCAVPHPPPPRPPLPDNLRLMEHVFTRARNQHIQSS